MSIQLALNNCSLPFRGDWLSSSMANLQHTQTLHIPTHTKLKTASFPKVILDCTLQHRTLSQAAQTRSQNQYEFSLLFCSINCLPSRVFTVLQIHKILHMHKFIYCSIIRIVKCWKLPKCPDRGDWLTELWHMHAVERYAVGNKEEEVAWRDFYGIWLNGNPRTQMNI